ncbi:hypothetical protein R6Z07F_015520 [Ovis aries]
MEGVGQPPEANPAFHPQSERTPHPARRQREAWSRPCCPKGLSRGASGPSPSPDQLLEAALGEATALAPETTLPSFTDTQPAAALTDREGGRGPARRRRGWGGCGDGGSAVPDLARPRAQARLRPLSGRPGPGGRTAKSLRRRAWQRWFGGSRRYAASTAPSRSQRRLLGRARPAVTSARLPPVPPPLTRTTLQTQDWQEAEAPKLGGQTLPSTRSLPPASRVAAGPSGVQTGSCPCQRGGSLGWRPRATPRLHRPRGGSRGVASLGSGAADREAPGGLRICGWKAGMVRTVSLAGKRRQDVSLSTSLSQ